MKDLAHKYSRQVAFVRIGDDGEVSDVCGAPDTWPARTARHVVEDIELGLHAYHLSWDGETTEIFDESDGHGRFLSATRDGDVGNLLHRLPRF